MKERNEEHGAAGALEAPRGVDARDGDAVRRQVAEDYARALERSRAGGTACCATPAGTAAKLAGYRDELARHEGAAQSSFGCGNPLAFSEVERGQTVLDLGSGAGLDLLIAAERVGSEGRVIGVDMTDDMIAAARANAERKGYTNVEVRRGLIEELPVEDASVDWVISNCVVNLSPEKDRVFAEIRRVLKPGGRFSISDIVVEDLPEELQRSAAAYSACVGGAISEAAYAAGLRAAGLVDVRAGERFEYEPEQVRELVSIDAGEAPAASACCGTPAPADASGAPELRVEELRGKVASVRFSGRRPPAGER